MSGERVVQLLPLPQEAEGKSIGLLSSDGRFKRLPLADFQDLSGRATSVLKLKEGVNMKRVVLCQDGEDLVVGSSTGRLLRLEVNEENLPVMGRNAQGPVLLRLLPGETVIGAAAVTDSGAVCLATQQGLIKQLAASEIRQCNRGDIGQICMRFEKNDRLQSAVFLQKSGLLSATLTNGNSMRLKPSEFESKIVELNLQNKETIVEIFETINPSS